MCLAQRIKKTSSPLPILFSYTDNIEIQHALGQDIDTTSHLINNSKVSSKDPSIRNSHVAVEEDNVANKEGDPSAQGFVPNKGRTRKINYEANDHHIAKKDHQLFESLEEDRCEVL